MRSAALLLIAAAAWGCSRPGPLPAQAELPIGLNQDCGCLRDRVCATIEQAPGWSEVRRASCRWMQPGAVALCRYEERRVDHERPEGYERPGRGGALIELSPWRRAEVTARRLGEGWCAG